jgi:dipeptidyl aminopeptidase/acylaminoacyl peptidase
VKIPSAENATSGGDEVAVLNPSTGKYWKLDLDGGGVREVSWAESNKLDIYTETERRPRGKRFALESNVWREVGPASSRLSDERNRIAVHQDINSPPILALTSNSNRRLRTLLDPNPRLATEYRLGRVRFLEGNLSTGERWTASLTLPTNYILGRRYPMVIQVQARPVREDEFSLYGRATDGNGLGPSDIAPYAAQILAGRDIATLQLGVDARFGTPLEVEPFVRAFQEVSDSLVAQGLVRRDRVGLSGFSRMGYYVVKALVKSNAQFAAAISTDNFDPGYVQTLLANTYADAEQAIGAPPFGDGLRTWLEQSIGFNVEKIQTPLLLIGQSGSTRENVLWQWEIVGRLRQLKRPIEMYLMPDIDAHPSHSMQNPRQILAVQGRAVDWFDFWLNDRESSDPTKQQQYSQWRRLRSAVAGARDHSE